MDTTEKILLIVLAAALAVFLILAIVAISLVIRLLKSANRVTDKAEQLITSAEAVGTVFRKSAEQMSFVRLIRNVAEHVSRSHNKSHKEDSNE